MPYTRTRFLEYWPGFETVQQYKRAAQNEDSAAVEKAVFSRFDRLASNV